MKKVTYQAFCKAPKKYLKDLPFTITMFGKLYAQVRKYPAGVATTSTADIDVETWAVEKEPPQRFNFQEAEYCQSCRKYVPKILMELHSHVVHGL